mmetsp:Transcript_28689/g.75363  ORF Transcript_28689/g.75363 Transcript_28689/m.75363 type:complete len:255 (-) Transcript_28689:2085-2849(-)
MSKAKAEEIKREGNEALNGGDMGRAEQLYSQAANFDKRNHAIFSNRSKARLALRNFHGAVADAETAIKLNPTWAKGFFRLGEVYAETQNWDRARVMYSAALDLTEPGDNTTLIQKRLTASDDQLKAQLRLERLAPIVAAVGGALFGTMLVWLDARGSDPLLGSWLAALAMVAVMAAITGAAGWLYTYFQLLKRQSYLMEREGGRAATAVPGPSTAIGGENGRATASPSATKPKVRRKVAQKPPWAKGGNAKATS